MSLAATDVPQNPNTSIMESPQPPSGGNGKLVIGTRGIQPANASELWQVSQRISASGLAPKGMERTETIFVALEMGLELGMPMMMALRSIAVINGKPAIYGDAALALVRSTGLLESFSEWFEIDGRRLTTRIGDREIPRSPNAKELENDALTAYCMVERFNDTDPLVYGFSVGDAKKAALWGKAGPWQQYPARMMKFRARGFCLRDKFTDVLQGMYTSEEADDMPTVISTGPSRLASDGKAKLEEMRRRETVVEMPQTTGNQTPNTSDETPAPVTEQPATNDRKLDTSTAQDAPAELPDVSTYEKFQAAMNELAMDQGIAPGLASGIFVKISSKAVTRPTSGGTQERQRIYAAAVSGKLNWETGQIQ